jgi:hypothetical protein
VVGPTGAGTSRRAERRCEAFASAWRPCATANTSLAPPKASAVAARLRERGNGGRRGRYRRHPRASSVLIGWSSEADIKSAEARVWEAPGSESDEGNGCRDPRSSMPVVQDQRCYYACAEGHSAR